VKRVPLGSSVEVSRRFHPILWGSKYYCRIHSPLSARQTANYIQKSPNLSVGTSYGFGKSMNGWGLIRAGNFYDVPYDPIEVSGEGTEIHPRMIVWPEENGSTIEFYYETNF